MSIDYDKWLLDCADEEMCSLHSDTEEETYMEYRDKIEAHEMDIALDKYGHLLDN